MTNNILAVILALLTGCTTVTTDDPSWEYPKEYTQ